ITSGSAKPAGTLNVSLCRAREKNSPTLQRPVLCKAVSAIERPIYMMEIVKPHNAPTSPIIYPFDRSATHEKAKEQRPVLCRFSAAGNTVYQRAHLAGGRKAPRHEIAVWGRAVGPRLWGFRHGLRL